MSTRPRRIPFLKVLLWGVGASLVLALVLCGFLISRQEPPQAEASSRPASVPSPAPPVPPGPSTATQEHTAPASRASSTSVDVQPGDAPEDKSVEALQMQAENAFWEGRFHEAVELGRLCASRSAKNAECRKLIGDALAALNHKDEAAQAYRAFLSMTSDQEHSAEIRQVLERLETAWEQEKESEDAATGPILRPSLARAAPLAKEQARSAYAEALKLFGHRMLYDATERAEDCIALEPNNVDCNLLAAAADREERYYRRFLQLSPNVRKHSKLQRALKKYYWSRMLQ